ncbi:TPA: DUF4250 domain-containing protein [Vibrio cholerae]|jgi:hypothetical protein|uniref:DUF4250 domain-containing protein n=8 Tax=Vibrio TaxID=662 RepID=Q9KTN1_VIBCH|nr:MULTISPECIES: DUF4250 domain-containing protein [Vibrio]AEA78021.1 hypothetical protein VCLMA_A0746 [Vibrio cholerae LMA3984-4]EAZ73026.1 hypothetical protein A5C_0884 [Vibrio cholerae NCTC 8457]EEY47604.1 hypothetical protein VIG_002445 [Vibrio cholerae INDRE 91/1]EEY51888.1 hypothetical protein VIH_001095 [Vibrio cholerae CT 5369-93]EYC46859.1 hypothetical protein AZ32_17700 [Vibrio cholerae O1 biovar El Tor str. L-3226]KQA29705.1 hypothetical protein F546_04395 [Vibrio paracholerae 877-
MNLANFATMDPIMLMSIINMKLRDDFGGDLDKLVNYFDIDRSALEAKLASAGFEFLPQVGQFR